MSLWRGTFFCVRFLLLIWLLRIINTYPEPTFLKIEDLAGTSWRSSISLFLLTVKSFVFAHRIYMEVHISHTYPGTDCISAHRLTHSKLHSILFNFFVGNYECLFGNIRECEVGAEISVHIMVDTLAREWYTLTSHTALLSCFCWYSALSKKKRLAYVFWDTDRHFLWAGVDIFVQFLGLRLLVKNGTRCCIKIFFYVHFVVNNHINGVSGLMSLNYIGAQFIWIFYLIHRT